MPKKEKSDGGRLKIRKPALFQKKLIRLINAQPVTWFL